MTHQFKLIECAYSDELSKVVTQHLALGWDLWGNPFVVEAEYDGDVMDIHYFQAMVHFDATLGHAVAGHVVTDLGEQPAGFSTLIPETPVPPTAQDFGELSTVIATMPFLRLVPAQAGALSLGGVPAMLSTQADAPTVGDGGDRALMDQE